MHIKEILKSVRRVQRGNTVYYNLTDFKSKLTDCDIDFGDLMLLPFYLDENITYELYWFELSASSELRFEDHVLKKTGAADIKGYDPKILNNFKICFISADDDMALKLTEYTDHLLDNKELQNDLKKINAKYSPDKLYFEYYLNP